jgi:chemotaxis response regulator CheB
LVPGELDPDDKNNRRQAPDTPEEIAIIAAYIEGLDRLNAFYATFPADPNDPVLVDGPFTAEVIEFEQETALKREAERRVLDVSGGLTLRPYIVSFTPGETTALVFDCQLDATVWRNADTGEVVPPPNDSFPNTGPDVATATSLSIEMELVGGEWLVGTGSSQPGACFDA